MVRLVLPASEPAAPETIEEHLRIGGYWLQRALREHPDLRPEDALATSQGKAGILDGSSVGRYRADLRHTLIAEMSRTGRMSDFPAAWKKVNAAVSARKKIIPKKDRRTSALKVEDATEEEARALFYELKRHGLKYKNPNTILACLFVLVAGHSGHRPIELRGASFDGTTLTLPNAKKRPGKPPTRTIDVSGRPKDVRTGIGLLLSLIDHDLSKREFAKWQKCLAGQLQRGCERVGIRVLSLYSFRHIAIGSWAAAGLSPREIALLCGHTSIRTAHTHYARGNVGHKRSAVARAGFTQNLYPDRIHGLAGDVGGAKAERLAQAKDKNDDTRQNSAGRFIVEDMPMAKPKKSDGRPALSPEEVRSAFARHLDPRPADKIDARLAKARKTAEDISPAEPGETKPEHGNG